MLRFNRKISAILLLFFSLPLAASPVILHFKDEAKPVMVKEKSSGVLKLDIAIPELSLEKVTVTSEDDFTRIRIPGEYTTREPGHPELPVIRRLIKVPADYKLIPSVEDSSLTELSLRTRQFPEKPYPVQPPRPKRLGARPEFATPDREAYQKNTSFPPIRLTDLGILRDERIYRLDIFPVNYIPAEGKLVLRKSLTVSLEESYDRDYPKSSASPVFKKITASFLSTSEEPPSLIQSPPGYLIVTPSLFEPELQAFISWKKLRGFQVDVLVLESLGTPDTAAIRDAIHQRFLFPGPGKSSPSFVLLVGDETLLPPFEGLTGDHVTDLPYVTVTEGDYLPDMYLGRLSAGTVSELTPQLDKILMAEQYTYSDPSHLNNVMLIAGWDESWAEQYGYPAVNYVHEYYLTEPEGFTAYKYLTSQAGEFSDAVKNQLNTGHSFIYYTGHGSAYSWGDPSVNTTDLSNMQSFGSAPLVITNGCQTSNFAKGLPSFSETWMRLENRGASAVIGATNDTYWDEDLWWAVGLYDIYQDGRTPTQEETGTGMFDIPFIRADLDNPSALIYAGNLAVEQAGDINAMAFISPHYYWEVYELFGDPSMTLRFGESDAFSVITENRISWGATELTVETGGVPWSLAGLTLKDSLVTSGYTDEWGRVTLSFDPVRSLDDLTLTVTGPGYIPFEKTISVIEPSQLTTDRDTLTILTSETLNLEIRDPDGLPLENILLWAWSPGYSSDTVITNSNGQAELTLTVPYGPEVFLKSEDPSGFYPPLRDTLAVNGGNPFSEPQIHLTSQYGVEDSLVPNIPFILTGNAEVPVDVWYSQDVNQYTGGGDSIDVLTSRTHRLNTALTAPGYDTYKKDFPVVTLFTNLAGTITDEEGQPVKYADILIEGGEYRSYRYKSDTLGNYRTKDPILMEPLRAQFSAFGYNSADTLLIPHWPVDTLHISLNKSPRVTWAARVYDINGEPLEADYALYIGTGDSLYQQGICTDRSDSNLIVILPSYTYTLHLSAPGYIPIRREFNTDESPFLDLPMSLREGILIVNDDTKKRFKHKEDIIPYTETSSLNTAFIMADILRDAGFHVTVKAGFETNPAHWNTYDGVIYARGDDQASVSSTLQKAMADYCAMGGPLLIEGGELGYKHYEDDFGRQVLRIKNWIIDKGGTITFTPEGKEALQDFYPLPDHLEHVYEAYGDQDVLDPAPEVLSLGSWSERPSHSSLIYAPDTMAFMSFNFSSLVYEEDRHHLLLNMIRLLPFINPNRHYPPHAWKEKFDVWKDSVITVSPLTGVWDPDGDSLNLVSVYSGDIQGSYETNTLEQSITYSAPPYANVSDTLYFSVSDGRYSDEGMLIFSILGNTPPGPVTLIAPENNYINRDSSSVLLKWSLSEDPDSDTITYLAELSQSDGLSVTDTLLMTEDTLLRVIPRELGFEADLAISWKVRTTDGQDTSRFSGSRSFSIDHSVFNALDEEKILPAHFSAGPNYPNPFNPVTTIPLALPEADQVSLRIYDIRGAQILKTGPFSMQAGYHSLRWDGKNSSGHSVSTGMYIAIITTRNGYSARLKLLHMK